MDSCSSKHADVDLYLLAEADDVEEVDYGNLDAYADDTVDESLDKLGAYSEEATVNKFGAYVECKADNALNNLGALEWLMMSSAT